MKKLFMLLIAISSIAINGICYAYIDAPQKEPTREEININKLDIPPIPRPRSAVELIEAYINRTDSTIEVYFNYMFGDVTVTIEDAVGNVVTSQVCDTDADEVLILASPEAEGEYTIKIAGQDLSAEGVFAI